MTGASSPLNFLLATAFALATASTAFAGKAAKPEPQGTLPGVQGDYRIVQPMPEPDHDADPASNGQFKIGDMDVRIGGSVTVDIRAGSLPPPRR